MSHGRPMMHGHAHRNSFSAATYTNNFGAPPQNPYRHATNTKATGYESPWPVYALDWCRWPRSNARGSGKIAIGSFSDDMPNRLQVLQHADDGELHKVAEISATLPFPVTKVMWEPPRSDKNEATMIATSGDYLRVFSVGSGDGRQIGKISQEVLLGNVKPEDSAPLTSFDWNKVDSSIIVTASVDTTCTVWDLNTAQARTQLIAHDKEVFDVTFTAGSVDNFASVGSDGSVRLFDLRALEHSTILYESQSSSRTPTLSVSSPSMSNNSNSPSNGGASPLLRLSACERDANLLATFAIDYSVVQVLDIRQPGTAILELEAHAGSVNAVQWAPNSRHLIATCADDSQVLVWDCNNAEQSKGTSRCTEPALAWTAESEVNNISWNADGDRIASAFGKTVQSLRVS